MMTSNLEPLSARSNWGPDESNDDILLEQTFMFSSYILGIGFAVQFVLYFGVMRILWNRRKAATFFSWALMIHSSAMCLASLLCALATYVAMEEAYIHNRNFPGGIPAFLGAATGLWYNIAGMTGLVAGAALSDFVLLWRCYIIWSFNLTKARTNLVMAIPTIMALATLALGIVYTVLLSTMPLSYLDLKVEHLGLAYFSLSVTLNVLLTSMIVFRLKSYQKDIEDCLGKENAALYVSISSLFIESAALYIFVAVPLLITTAIPSVLNQVFLGIAPPTQICCSYWIIWRVADGRAWSRQVRTSTMPYDSGSVLEFRKPRRITLTKTSPGVDDGLESQVDGMTGMSDQNIKNGASSIQLTEYPIKVTNSNEI